MCIYIYMYIYIKTFEKYEEILESAPPWGAMQKVFPGGGAPRWGYHFAICSLAVGPRQRLFTFRFIVS